ncbi:uncharacterized protein Fot_03141 [Forsythia ovata]|uniref:HMG box domain-containing protein n=1 Tax=Forsythia ovata TaxID=205694 RepID=A0ABD1X8V0_9LAMI
MKMCKDGNEIEIDRKGVETWKKMSKEERKPFVLQAEKINSAYVKLLLEEENEIEWVDDEADSAEIGKKHDKNNGKFELHYDSESSSGFNFFESRTLSFDTKDLEKVKFLRGMQTGIQDSDNLDIVILFI